MIKIIEMIDQIIIKVYSGQNNEETEKQLIELKNQIINQLK